VVGQSSNLLLVLKPTQSFLILGPMGVVQLTLVSKLSWMVGGSGKLLLALASIVIFGIGPHDPYFNYILTDLIDQVNCCRPLPHL
jgi:hypothetical protein